MSERIDPKVFREKLERRLTVLAVMTFRYLDALPKKSSTSVISYQLGKSASSIGANYHEANRAESRDDFTHKIQIALKEASESCYWFGVLAELYPTHETGKRLQAECLEIRNLLQAIGKTLHASKRIPKSPSP